MNISDAVNSSITASAAGARDVSQISGGLQRLSAGPDSDEVRVSGMANILRSGATEHAARLQALSAAVRNGTYSVPSDMLSRAMVNEAVNVSASSR